MDKNKILELLARKMAGEASHRELDELNELMNRFPDAVYYEEFLAQVWTQPSIIDGTAMDPDQAYQRHRTKYTKDFNRKRKVIGNLIVLLALGVLTSLYVYYNNKPGSTVDIVAATLIRGAIELSVHSRPKQKILLNPSEKFALEDKLHHGSIGAGKNIKHLDLTLTMEHIKPLQIGQQRYIGEVAWKDSLLVFKDESFAELKPKLERWYDMKVTVKPTVLESYRFTGVLKNEDIKEALTAMQLIKPFKFKLNANEVIIY